MIIILINGYRMRFCYVTDSGLDQKRNFFWRSILFTEFFFAVYPQKNIFHHGEKIFFERAEFFYSGHAVVEVMFRRISASLSAVTLALCRSSSAISISYFSSGMRNWIGRRGIFLAVVILSIAVRVFPVPLVNRRVRGGW